MPSDDVREQALPDLKPRTLYRRVGLMSTKLYRVAVLVPPFVVRLARAAGKLLIQPRTPLSLALPKP